MTGRTVEPMSKRRISNVKHIRTEVMLQETHSKASQLSFAVLWDGLWWTVCKYEIRGCVIGGSMLSPPGSGDQGVTCDRKEAPGGRSLGSLWTASFIPRWGTTGYGYVNFGWEIFVMRGRVLTVTGSSFLLMGAILSNSLSIHLTLFLHLDHIRLTGKTPKCTPYWCNRGKF